MSERSQDAELTGLESALRGLRPKPEALDRAVLMYRAGRASARGGGWPAATALSTVLAFALGIAWWVRPAPVVIEHVVYVAAPSAQPDDVATAREDADSSSDDASRGAWSRYVRLQERIFHRGLEGLPSPSAPPEQPPSLESLLRPY
jgi:hypothetical protein